MTTVVRDELRCGECGHHAFELWHEKGPGDVRFGGQGSGGIEGNVVVVCLKCKSETVIRPVPARITTDAEGTLCGGWSGPREEDDSPAEG